MKKLLFVCSGNTCRSPLAQGIAKKIFSDDLPGKVEISSAGSSALEGSPASTLAVRVASKHSIDLTCHRSALLNRTLVRGADLIITMGSKHRQTVGVIDPPALLYTCLLTDFCDDEEGDISDPMGMDEDGYEATFETIEKCIRGLVDKLESFEGWKK